MMEGVIKRNVATVGNVDRGKTTLTDLLMLLSPDDKRWGRASIERGDTLTDISPVEQEMGISIHSVPTRATYNVDDQTYELTIVDTPGHPEFGYQVSTSLEGVEAALFLIDMNKGVHVHDIKLLKQLEESGLPILAVLNKVDLMKGHDHYQQRLEEIKATLQRHNIQLNLLQAPRYGDAGSKYQDRVIGLDDFFLGERPLDSRRNGIPRMNGTPLEYLLNGNEIPTVVAAGKFNGEYSLGGTELLAHLLDFFPEPTENNLFRYAAEHGFDPETDFSAKIINRLPNGGRGGSVTTRIVTGTLSVGNKIYNATGEGYKINHIHTVNGKSIRKASAGDIVLLNLDDTDARSGDTLHGDKRIEFPRAELGRPIIQVDLYSPQETRLAEALEKIERYDPSYRVEKTPRGISVASTNSFHLEVLLKILEHECRVPVSAKPFRPQYVVVPDKETTVEGTALSRNAGYAVTLTVTATSDGSEHRVTANSKNLGVARQLESMLKTERWHDALPLERFEVEVAEARALYGDSDSKTKERAVQDAVERLLYESRGLALYEPYITFTSEARLPGQDTLVMDFLRRNGLTPSHHATETTTQITAEIPVRVYMALENTFLKALKDVDWKVTASSYQKVPANVGREIEKGLVDHEYVPEGATRQQKRISTRKRSKGFRQREGQPEKSTFPQEAYNGNGWLVQLPFDKGVIYDLRQRTLGSPSYEIRRASASATEGLRRGLGRAAARATTSAQDYMTSIRENRVRRRQQKKRQREVEEWRRKYGTQSSVRGYGGRR